jgi:exosortase K
VTRHLHELAGAAERHASTLVAGAVAVGLKYDYSRASADELRWILAPTSWLTSLFTSGGFEFRVGEGYLNREQSVLVSPACAGINFLVVALLSLVLGFAGRFESFRQKGAWCATSLGLAYVSTLLVNALRISLSVAVAHLAARVTGLTFQSVHRLLGVVVYLGGLLVLCLTIQFWLSSRGRRDANRGAPLLALGCYAGITLVVPLLGGAAHNPQYWTHAAPVSVMVGVSAALLFAARGRTWDDGRHAFRSPEHPERVATEPGSRA